MNNWTALVLGLAGSLHCAVMCGPLLLALGRARSRGAGDSWRRVVYHLGRITIYAVLGGFAGLAGRYVVPMGWQRWFSVSLGLLLLAGLWLSVRSAMAESAFGLVLRLQTAWRRSFQGRTHSVGAQWALGAMNGLLPCGLVYVAAAGAATTGSFLTGMLYMAMFGAGTLPLMLGVHLAGQRLPWPARWPLASVTRVAIGLMATLLILRGLQLGIPYLSPQFAGDHGTLPLCH